MSGHHVVFIDDLQQAKLFLKEIGSDAAGVGYMMPKAVFRCIKIKNISCIAANIIKQEMLSKGGEAAVAKKAVFTEGNTDVLLMGTLKQFRLLLEKLKIQAFGLKKLASEIEKILKSLEKSHWYISTAQGKSLELGVRTQIMGIVNVTPDSFYDGGKYNTDENAYRYAMQLIEDGADIIDIGGASSRPDSIMVDEDEEIKRILPLIKKLNKEKIIISVDTFRSKVANLALANGADIINDIGRLQLDKSLLANLSEYDAPVILMHNRLQMQKGMSYEDLISDIISELNESILEACNSGLKEEKIILDPGIGFGKSVEENLILINRLQEFKSLPHPILVGASRKSFIGKTLNLDSEERLEGSLAVAAASIMNGAQILRVHDVKESKRLAVMLDAVKNANG